MARTITADEVLTQQHIRGFLTTGASQPGNPAQYYGLSGQYFSVTGIENPVSGGITRINIGDPRRRKRFRAIGRTVEAPDLGTFVLAVYHKHGTVPNALGGLPCPLTVHLSAGKCKDPTDLNRGYESYVYILSNGEVTDRTPGDMFPLDSDDLVSTELTLMTADQYAVGPLAFGEVAAPEINAEVSDGVWYTPSDCTTCQDGPGWFYAITRSIGGSPSFQPEIIYTTNQGQTWTQANITGLGSTAVPTAIDVVGSMLVVLVNSENALYWSTINENTGAPGTWTKVTTGFQTGGNPNDLYVKSATEVYIVGNGGYIYLARDVTAGPTVLNNSATTRDLLRIAGDGEETIVTVGDIGTILISRNQGATFAQAVTLPTGSRLVACEVVADLRYWVGTNTGLVFYTLNGGETWNAGRTPSGATGINDIVFVTDQVGYIAYTVSGPDGRLWSTLDGGESWTGGSARIVGGTLPVHDKTNRVAVPRTGFSQTDCNYVVLCGLAGDGSDGVALLGRANIL